MDLITVCQDNLKNVSQNTEDLEVWVVGGAVRDDYLGKDFKDLDFTVVGETEESMLERGFEKIEAQSFPVFHDDNGHEYALARTETSTGDGYHEFEAETENVEIIDDLKRRDFTMNAMAKRVSDGVYEYPVAVEGNRNAHSIKDLDEGVIRHVSDSFEEDPVRILRMARFASRFPDFQIASDTMQYAQEMSPKLELGKEIEENVPGERVQEEIIKAMKEAEDPVRFWEVMKKSGALKFTLPELAEMEEVSAGPERHHQEGDTWTHTMMVMREAQRLRPNDHRLLLMALVHDIGKIKTQGQDNTGGHDREGIKVIEEISDRLKLSNNLKQTLIDASKQHMRIFNVPLTAPNSMNEKKVIDLVQQLDHEKGATQEELMDLAEADTKGRIPSQSLSRRNIEKRLETAREAINTVDAEYVASKRNKEISDYSGESLGQMITMDRVEYMKENQERVSILTYLKDRFFN
jgi:tRNA nucleotidyltransferase (CCA-adding enzyme)